MGALEHLVRHQPQSFLSSAVALSATVHTFEIALNDADRGVYQGLEFRVARHPSETAEYLWTRVLAYCLEYVPGLAFSAGGLSDPDAPALAIRDLTGRLESWIEVGLPEPARLHRAAKAAPRVAVYSHRDLDGLLARLAAEPTHRADRIEFFALDPTLLAALSQLLTRRMRFDLAISGGEIYLSHGESTYSGGITPSQVAAS